MELAIGGGIGGRHPAELIEFVRRTPDGAVLTIKSSMRALAPMNAKSIALGVHVRVGNEDICGDARASV
ncbi:3-keto-5-aminohexanoate cleavage protein [Streptomyces sp. Marseille-Q5077]|uniref:3-keto-5-aminohexanoate cleavage protein n=1 Tax=Streptomyces sp. Marseille-Q5077 TaxID=3418995 RepID=UPI003D00ABF0